jgi:hypothetical protein
LAGVKYWLYEDAQKPPARRENEADRRLELAQHGWVLQRGDAAKQI